jgi:adenine-specific DNA-methyltransferase
VPYRVLDKRYSFGEPGDASENKIIHGDNLEALKALLPEYEGRVDCVYIDPPYNTGNEAWVYNDNVNDPKMKRWLHEVVGKEGEDLSRHDKWLCMMYPRLMLLKRLLASQGVILVSIDNIEIANLQVLLDEIFGISNRIGTIVWRNVTDNNPTRISTEHEYVLSYCKNIQLVSPEWKSNELAVKKILIDLASKLIEECSDQNKLQEAYTKWYREHKEEIWPFQDYKFIDSGGIYTGSRSVHNPGKEGYRYDVYHPSTGKACKLPLMGYRFPSNTMDRLLSEGKILFGEDETKLIELKLYVQEYKAKLSSIIELDTRMGTNEIKAIFPESKSL